jgi:hypothetical protein
VNTATKTVIEKAYNLLKPAPGAKITVTPESTGDELTVFNDIQGSTFGKAVGFMNTDYGIDEPTSYVISNGIQQPTLEINLK